MDPTPYATPIEAISTLLAAESSAHKLHCTAERLLPGSPQSNQLHADNSLPRLAMPTNTFWRPGQILRVKFFPGATPYVQHKIQNYAKQWSEVANIHLSFNDAPDAEIRVSFVQGDGSWSQVGTNSRNIPLNNATMNFGWFHDSTRDEEFSRTVLHEFGHALGCVHEHQSSTSRLNWDLNNINQIYDYFRQTSGWDYQMVNAQVLNRYSAVGMRTTSFDDQSIMLYEYPNYLFTDGRGTSRNWMLSDADKDFICRVYPFRSHSIGQYTFNRTNTSMNFRTMVFDPEYSQPPQLALGISSARMNISDRTNLWLDSEDVSNANFRLATYSTPGTTLSSATANWVEVEANQHNMQTGLYRWRRDTGGELNTVENIQFTTPYYSPPRIIVWVSGFSFGLRGRVGLHASAENITPFSFDLRVQALAATPDGSGQEQDSFEITWLACPHDDAEISIGSASVNDDFLQPQPAGTKNSGHVPFEQQCNFISPPRVYIAISGLHIAYKPPDLSFAGSTTELSFGCSATEIMNYGFRWNLDIQKESHLVLGTVSWIAFAGRGVGGQNTTQAFYDPNHWSERMRSQPQILGLPARYS